MRRPLPHTPRHEYPSEFRRRLSYDYVQARGLAELSRHPVTYARWEWPASVGVTLGAFTGVGVLGAFASRGEIAFWIPVLGGVLAWVVVLGLPWLLPQGIAGLSRRRRLRAAVEAMPGYRPGPGACPGQAGDRRGMVTYHDGSLRVVTPQGEALRVPFASIHFVEELPPKGLWGFPGVDVLTRSGEWTEIRMTDKSGLIRTLETSGVPVLLAVKGYPG